MTKNKLKIATLAMLTDIGLAYYSYKITTNYEQFQKYAKLTITDPTFRLQVYQLIVQTLVFIILLFLFFHFLIYLFFYRGNKFSKKYVRFYLITAIISLTLTVLFSFDIYFLIGTLIYGYCFISFRTEE